MKMIAYLFGAGWAVLYAISLFHGVNDLQLLMMMMLAGIWAEVL